MQIALRRSRHMFREVEGVDDSCAFCSLDAPNPHWPVDANKVLLESEHFLLVPALGPLTAGHALIVSRSHSNGLVWMPAHVRADYAEFQKRLRRLRPTIAWLFAEHGGGSEGMRPCINHTHINLIPGVAAPITILAHKCEQLDSQTMLNRTPDTSYICLEWGEDVAYFSAERMGSQFLRRLLWGARGRDDWDWAVFPGWDVVAATIDYWTN